MAWHLEAPHGPLQVCLLSTILVILLLHCMVGQVHLGVAKIFFKQAEPRVAESAESLAVQVNSERRKTEAQSEDPDIEFLAANLNHARKLERGSNRRLLLHGRLCLEICKRCNRMAGLPSRDWRCTAAPLQWMSSLLAPSPAAALEATPLFATTC